MAYLLRGQSAAQDVYRVFMTNDIPGLLLYLHADMVAEIGSDDKQAMGGVRFIFE